MVDFNTSGVTNTLFSLFSSLWFWLIAIFIFFFLTIGFLIIRRNRKLKVPVLEFTEIGNEKTSINTKPTTVTGGKKLKAGWFKEYSALGGLWDYGTNEVMKTNDGRTIQDVSSTDYHEINGKQCLIVARSPYDPLILVPLSQFKIKNKELLAEIAPAEFRKIAVDIIKRAEKETTDKMAQLIQWALMGGVIVFAFVSIILIIQMVKNGQAEATGLVRDAWSVSEAQLKQICTGVSHTATTVVSGAP